MTQTIASLQDKTPEELNVICAELCGWKRSFGNNDSFQWISPRGTGASLSDYFTGDQLPPYATSYDAILGECHKVDEKLLRDSLAKVLNCAWYQSAKLLRASPADLTRALILTLTT